jgi:hypothetical protein
MLARKENGKLSLKSLELEIFLGDLYEQCETEKEVEWLERQLQTCVECIAQERISEIEDAEQE